MVSCVLLILGPLWSHFLTLTCRGEELPRDAVLSLFRERVLEGLGPEEPPQSRALGVDGYMARPEVRLPPWRALRTRRMAQPSRQSSQSQETFQIILFPRSDSSCAGADSPLGETSYATYHFQPSMNHRQTLVTSAHFWFYTERGVTANSSAPLFILTSAKQLVQAAVEPWIIDSEGWSIYQLDQNLLASVAEGPFMLQVWSPARQCHADEPEKMPFLHLHAQARGPARTPRQAPVIIPWSSSAVDLLQRPSPVRPLHSNCHRAEVKISFEELGWDSWIVHPKVLSFYYCHGNCSSWDGTTTRLGITQCCAPAPGTMKSLKVTTMSDGGYSFKCETLLNIVPEECTCI